ncbi:MAG: phytanoyl-CoA dioxygenase family protein [SAR324 cluster bacterium]|jgi:phytanoyl-CoA hydroxylase|nr:phytanoyl-CoA dioxygenase [Bacteroidota bacterium]MDP7336215.1 phytanoyl-CoA dioxygenase family protein [SAR324 cluster bacterium]|tara:strand:+ start:560 stop:1318 length:759 start_codon:yes stop_codon:yes gene_type:complete
MLNNEERKNSTFKDNGFFVSSKYLNKKHTNKIISNVDRFISDIVPKMPNTKVYYDEIKNKDSLKQIQMMFAYDKYFYDLIYDSSIFQIAEKLLEEKPTPINLQYFNKAPLWSKPTPPHQDGYYFKINPIKAITLWLALDDVDETNGCISYYPKSHLHGLRNHVRSGVLGFSQCLPNDDNLLNECNEIRMTCSAGSLLAHDALLIHSADKNLSHRPRRSLGFIYYGSSVEINKNKASEYQKSLDDDLMKKGLV